MLKRCLVLILFSSFLMPLGCMTNRPVMWSWPHHKRRVLGVLEDLHKFHMDFDRIVFDMDERPLEDID